MADRSFGDLGIPFPLFEAPVNATTDYAGIASCDVCGASEQHCFEIGIGGHVELGCKQCGHRQYAQGCDAFADKCDRCGARLLEHVGSEEHPLVCYGCLRSARASITKDTEFGMVTGEEARNGITHGIPSLTTDMFETLPPDEEGWVSVKIPSEHLTELVSTPGYTSWQGDVWLFCCRAPMTFVGEWQQSDFQRHAADGDALKLAVSMVSVEVHRYWSREFPDQVCFYVFRCKMCGNQRAHTDMD